MLIESTRFGTLDLKPDRVITFDKGLLGFESHDRFVMLEAGEDSCLWWLQSVDSPELAFVVTDPQQFIPSYRAPVGDDVLESLGCSSLREVQVLAIVNKQGRTLTANLQGPLVINAHQKRGRQLVVSDKRFSPRVRLMELPEPMAATA